MHTTADFSKWMTRDLFGRALTDALRKLDPRWQVKNPVIFIVWLGALATTFVLLRQVGRNGFNFQICFWLWFTILFANFAEALAEGRGKAQAASLRRSRSETRARLIWEGQEKWVPAAQLNAGDVVICRAGDRKSVV